MKKHETSKYAELRALFDEIYPQQPEHESDPRSAEDNNRWRMDRALSWLKRSEDCNPKNDPDERFLFLWISFNAAYGDDANLKPSRWKTKDHNKIAQFLCQIVKKDADDRLADVIRMHKKQFDKILAIRFLFRPFWQAAYIRVAWLRWSNPSSTFVTQRLKVQNGFATTFTVLRYTFDRLYTLRSQLFHGGASYRDEYNRSSLKPANIILGACVPEILKIMLEALNSQHDMGDWGNVAYPPFLKKPDDDANQNPPIGYRNS